jgi:hypothetical protein
MNGVRFCKLYSFFNSQSALRSHEDVKANFKRLVLSGSRVQMNTFSGLCVIGWVAGAVLSGGSHLPSGSSCTDARESGWIVASLEAADGSSQEPRPVILAPSSGNVLLLLENLQQASCLVSLT